MIGRWAPPNENDTGAYVRAVAASVGVGADEEIDVHEFAILRPLTLAIIRHENGQQPYRACCRIGRSALDLRHAG